MPIENILVLSGIVAAFMSFVCTLAWVSRHDGDPAATRAKPVPLRAPLNAGHA